MITKIEMEYMEAVKKIAREMSKPKGLDYNTFVAETAKAMLPTIAGQMPGEYVNAAKEAVKYAEALAKELMPF